MSSGDAEFRPLNDAAPFEVQRSPLGSQIASALRREIFLGRLRPGTRLGQQQLCEQFGTSRMPVRDALRELVYDGLLMRDGPRAVVVAPLSREDLIDAFQIEGVLNGLAARRATTVATEQDFELLRSLHADMKACADEGDHDRMAKLNWQFHRHINRLAGSRKLLATLRVVSLDVPRDYLIHLPQWAEKSNSEHEQIIEAMVQRDAARVERLMESHLTESGKGLADFLLREDVLTE